MIIEELELENWKVFREPHIFTFEDGINLLVGPNEAGKSTLLRSLEFLFFAKHNSKAKDIHDLQPWETTLSPRGRVIFTVEGERYQLSKQFLKEAKSVLSCGKEDAFMRIGEGSEAEKTLASLLSASPSAQVKGEREPLYRALWYLQQDSAMPDRWTEGVRFGMSSVVDAVVTSPVEQRIRKSIERQYNDLYTTGGKKGIDASTLKIQAAPNKLLPTITGLKSRSDEVCSCINSLSTLRQDIGILEQNFVKVSKILENTEKESDELEPELAKIPEWQDELVALKQKVEKAQVEVVSIRKTRDDYLARNTKTTNFERDLFAKREAIATANADSENAHNRIEVIEKQIQSEFDPRQERLKAEITQARNLQELRRIETDFKNLNQKQEILKKNEDAIAALKLQLDDLPVPDSDLFDTVEQIQNEILALEAQITAKAPRIRFIPKSSDFTLNFDPEPVVDGEDFVLTAPTCITIPHVGTIYVTGIPNDVQSIPSTLAERKSILSAHFEGYPCSTIPELRVYIQRIDRLVADKKYLNQNRDQLLKEIGEIDLNATLKKMGVQIQEKQKWIETVRQTVTKLTDSGLAEHLVALESQEQDCTDQKKILLKEQRDLTSKASKYEEIKNQLSQEVSSITGQIQLLQEYNEQTLKEYGNFSHLNDFCNKKEAHLERIREACISKREELRPKINLLQERQRLLEDSLGPRREDKRSHEKSLLEKKAELKVLSKRDLDREKQELEDELVDQQHQYSKCLIQADGVKLLHKMIKEAEEAQLADLGRPLVETVNRWLPVISDKSYSEMVIDPKTMIPQYVVSPIYKGPIAVGEVSYGTGEQLHVLLRLALGVVLSDNDRQLVVLDDRLVNADPNRLERLCSILKDVGRDSCQIVLATCNADAYASLEGHILNIPEDGIQVR